MLAAAVAEEAEEEVAEEAAAAVDVDGLVGRNADTSTNSLSGLWLN